MTDTLDTDHENLDWQRQHMTDRPVDMHAWFLREVLPLEAALTQFVKHHSRGKASIADLLQEIYLRVYQSAKIDMPASTKSFVFATAHNLLIDRVRREKVIPIEAVENLEALGVAAESPGPEAEVVARDELRHLQSALAHIAPRAREVFLLHHVDGMTPREIAVRLTLSENTVRWHLNDGIRSITDILYGDHSDQRKKP